MESQWVERKICSNITKEEKRGRYEDDNRGTPPHKVEVWRSCHEEDKRNNSTKLCDEEDKRGKWSVGMWSEARRSVNNGSATLFSRQKR